MEHASRSKQSRFTFAQFDALRKYSSNTPLRTIAHVDLDAFYAQCETVRLGLDPDVPLACQQWRGLIAVNYAARKFGITRHEDITEAKKKCPDLVLAHVATWKEGDTQWAYHSDPDIRAHKVSLDPYRRQSKLIFDIFYSLCEKVEYGGLDEAFFDLSKLVHGRICKVFPDIATLAETKQEMDRLEDFLPFPDMAAKDLRFEGELLPLGEDESLDEEDQDWDQVVFLFASRIIKEIRTTVWEKMKYTCSAGIAPNRVLAKLCSGYKKPNNQTVLRPCAVSRFMATVKFSKLRGLGGKLGEDITKAFDVPESGSIPFLLQIQLPDLVAALGEETANWLYHVIRGEDHSDVKPRPAIKSMLSAKNFRPNIKTKDQAEKWLQIFVMDIMGRILEVRDSDRDGKIRMPTTMTLHHRQSGEGARSRQCPIPTCPPSSLEETLFNTAKSLLRQLEKEGPGAYPCYQLSLGVTGFDSTITRNRAIEGFLVKPKKTPFLVPTKEPSPKQPVGLDSFLQPIEKQEVDAGVADASDHQGDDELSDANSFVCDDCAQRINIDHSLEHQDWHFARSLAEQLQADEHETQSTAGVQPESKPTGKRQNATNEAQPSGNKVPKLEKGQRTLFG
ncbi:hypothetical protein V1512DRAFT_47545 [Lipomyces arxii]|uniref:uncharacterized protein n=1 Tax=Lipomyces arxii TaxID=56418 RepID=UPI0034CD4986